MRIKDVARAIYSARLQNGDLTDLDEAYIAEREMIAFCAGAEYANRERVDQTVGVCYDDPVHTDNQEA